MEGYDIIGNDEAIRCHACGATSHNRADVEARYCASCKRFHELEAGEQVDMEDRMQAVIWTLYDHPLDYPDCFVARAYPMGSLVALPAPVLTAATVAELRVLVQDAARYELMRMPRDPSDDACVVESWL